MKLLQYIETDRGIQITDIWKGLNSVGQICYLKGSKTDVASYGSPTYYSRVGGFIIYLPSFPVNYTYPIYSSITKPVLEELSKIEVYQHGLIQYAHFEQFDFRGRAITLFYHPDNRKVRRVYNNLEQWRRLTTGNTFMTETTSYSECLQAFEKQTMEDRFYEETQIQL